jgi:hypothetical protein
MITDCSRFAELAPELALGMADSRQRAELLEHASDCLVCQRYLDSLTFVSEQLLAASPEVEPPSGFETRVLDRISQSNGAATVIVGRRAARAGSVAARRRRRLVQVLAVAAAIAVAVLSIVAIARWPSRTVVAGTVEQGAIVRADGTSAGVVRLLDKPRSMIVVTVDTPRRFEGRRLCELVLDDGRVVPVGSWSADDIAAGVWASGIGAELLHAAKMTVRDQAGVVVATAVLN